MPGKSLSQHHNNHPPLTKKKILSFRFCKKEVKRYSKENKK